MKMAIEAIKLTCPYLLLLFLPPPYPTANRSNTLSKNIDGMNIFNWKHLSAVKPISNHIMLSVKYLEH